VRRRLDPAVQPGPARGGRAGQHRPGAGVAGAVALRADGARGAARSGGCARGTAHRPGSQRGAGAPGDRAAPGARARHHAIPERRVELPRRAGRAAWPVRGGARPHPGGAGPARRGGAAVSRGRRRVARRQAMSHNRAMRTRSRDGARRHAADSLVFSFLSAADAVEARLEAALSQTGLSLAKLAVLHLLADAKEPLPLSDLAARHHCVPSNITQLVDRLEKDGLVRRRPDPEDRRSVLAELTPAGEQAHGKGMRALAEAQRAIVSGLKAGDAASLKSALKALG